jgi:transcriptional regulator with XRE-family HTH domain
MVRLFGDKVRYLRLQRELTQAELAQRVTLASHAQVNHLESGRRLPSLERVMALANTLEIQTDYLLRDEIPLENAEQYRASSKMHLTTMPGLFGDKIRFLRKKHGINQTTLTNQLQIVSQTFVSRLESGKRVPSPELVVRIADLFGVTTDYLLRDDVAVEGIDSQGE